MNDKNQALAGRFNLLPMNAVIFGPGAVEQLAVECDRLGMSRVLLVISPSLVKTTDIEERLERLLGERLVQTYSGSQPHVPDTVVLEAAAQARELGVNGILAVGGGSPVDLAKAINLCLTENVRTREELARYAVKFNYPDPPVVPSLTGTTLPQISVTTTLSAGEFTHITGVRDTVNRVKRMYLDHALTARLVIHDSELAQHTPRDLWASTGMRAVDHCIEGLCSSNSQPMTDALCSDGLRRLAKFLPISVADPSDLHAASQCQMGAWQSIFGLTNVHLGLSHSIGHQLGGRNGVPHGVTSCVTLPPVLAFNYEHTRDQQALVAQIFAEAMGVPVPQDGAAGIVREFIVSLGMPTTLREVGVSRDDFPFLASDAMRDMIVATNPRPLTGENDVIEVLEAAY